MDYVTPVEAVIPGVQGRVLGVLARSDAELTMRTVARLAEVSVNRAVSVLNGLVHLGIVERREVGRAAAVRLSPESEVAKLFVSLDRIRDRVIDRLRSTAESIEPGPASLVLFGSFARGEAGRDSDVDVLAVRPRDLSPEDLAWQDGVGRWADQATRIVGNPVNVVIVGQEELGALLRRRSSVWSEAARDGIILAGERLDAAASG